MCIPLHYKVIGEASWAIIHNNYDSHEEIDVYSGTNQNKK